MIFGCVYLLLYFLLLLFFCGFVIDRVAQQSREIMRLVVSVLLSVRLSVLSRMNRLTYDLDIWYVGRPWPWLGWECRSSSKAKNRLFTSLLHILRVKVEGRGQSQRSGSRSQIEVKGQGQISGAQWSILGAQLCWVQQRSTTTITSLRLLSVCL